MSQHYQLFAVTALKAKARRAKARALQLNPKITEEITSANTETVEFTQGITHF